MSLLRSVQSSVKWLRFIDKIQSQCWTNKGWKQSMSFPSFFDQKLRLFIRLIYSFRFLCESADILNRGLVAQRKAPPQKYEDLTGGKYPRGSFPSLT